MPRQPRVVFPYVPLHIVQRGNNRRECFYSSKDCDVYLNILAQCALDAGCTVHAYALMSNHVHLLVTPTDAGAASAMMKALDQRYVQYINRRYERVGTLWQGRFRSCLVEDARYFFVCQRYIELNPVRAGIVRDPAQYEWSSFRANALGVANTLVRPHLLYFNLGRDAREREQAYRYLFEEEISTQSIEKLRSATNRNHAIRKSAH